MSDVQHEEEIEPESRIVRVVAEDQEKTGGRPLLHAYGYGWVVAMVRAACKSDEYTIEQARLDRSRGKFRLDRPESVIAFALARGGERKASAAVRALTQDGDGA